MLFSPHFLDELRNRLSLPSEVGKHVRLTRRGHEYTGLCPFHKEKTPSFTVSEDKGFYHCFGCGAHGDIVSFVMAIEGISFPEAVERLAAQAGMEIPKSTPEERQKEKKRAELHEVMEFAASFYEKSLRDSEGSAALNYLHSRGVNDTAIANFRLGFSGLGGGLKADMAKRGVGEAELIAAGLFAPSHTAGKEPYEYFRNRIMFPITDKRGRVIAFGGRVMDESEPKYLNSPETELFHKGEVLYSLSKAAVPARAANCIILTEGYMDVISLHEAGFPFAVAPLGTALTERQIEELWRITPEPVICFDGDSAGKRAALRAADRVLPILKAGYSLKFNFLPEELDPDEYIKKYGQQAFSSFLQDSKPLVWLLWEHLLAGKSLDTPERRARLEKDVEDMVSRINDATVQTYYRQEFKNRLWDLFKGARLKAGSGPASFSSATKAKGAPDKRRAAVRTTTLPECQAGRDEGRMFAAYLICYPAEMSKWVERLGALTFTEKTVAEIIATAAAEIMNNPSVDRQGILDALTFAGLKDKLSPVMPVVEMLSSRPRFPDDINAEMSERFSHLELTALNAEIEATASELADCLSSPPPELWERFQKLKEEKNRLLAELY